MAGYDSYLAAINEELRAGLRTEAPPLRIFYEMMLYHLGLETGGTVSSSGKRLRPLACLLVHEGLTGDPWPALPAAAALELLHNFTLIHDDIEDQDETRRHRPTVWSRWGVAQAINAGDGMYAASRVAVQRLRERGVPAARVLEAVAALDRACVLVCEGQFLDISFESKVDVPRDAHRAMVARKTSALLRAAAEVPAVLAGAKPEVVDALCRFGERFGAAFQAHDDLLGVWGAAEATGKAAMNDLAKRKMTLPLVLAAERASPAQRAELAALYAGSPPLTPANVSRVREVLDGLDARSEVEAFVARERAEALRALDEARLRAGPAGLLRRLASEATGG